MRPNAAHSSILTIHLLWMAALLTAMAALTGCGAGRLLPPSIQSGPSIHGNVHGGQQPVAGAHVYLFAANTTGYAGNGIDPSGANSSVSLLNSATTGNADDLGAYVLSASDGTFDISGDYTCDPNDQVYLYAAGGNSGGGGNIHIGLLALLGNCPGSGNFATATPTVEINEVSTIAAAFAFAGYASDSTHVSTNGSPQALTGIANAFAGASNLVDLASGTALSTTPAGNGTVPTQTINTLANILASCVNSADSTGGFPPNEPSAACRALLSADYSGGAMGNASQNTSDSAIFIAHNPTNNVAYLFTIPSDKPPFGNALTSQPSDFTLSIAFTGGGLSYAAQPAIDAQGNVWVPDPTDHGGNGAILEFSNLGALLSGSWTQAGIQNPSYLAFDISGNAWIAGGEPNTAITEYSSSGVELATTASTGISYFLPTGPAFDLAGNLWVANDNGSSNLVEYSSSGALTQIISGDGLNDPVHVVFDPAGNLWIDNQGTHTVGEFFNGSPATNSPFSITDNTGIEGTALDASGNLWVLKQDVAIDVLNSSGVEVTGAPYNTAYSSSEYTYAVYEALDGTGNDWIATVSLDFSNFPPLSTNSFIELSNTGALLTPSPGIAINSSINPGGLAVDSAGNFWVAAGSLLFEYIGLSTPIETPLIQALADICLAQRPCLPQT